MVERMGHLAGGRSSAIGRSISRIAPLCWLLLLAAHAPPAEAQTVVPRDTTRRADSTRAPADTGARRPGDSLRAAPADSAGRTRPDSAVRSPADSARAAPADSARSAAPEAAPPSIADSVLAAACAQGGGLAANLLVVLFTPTATDSDRAVLAKAVGGRLAGPADAVRAGGYYLQVPNGDLDPTVADRVIRSPTVQEVGPVPCP